MKPDKKSVVGLIAQNMFRHPNFWNYQNFKNRLHVLALMLVPLSCSDKKLKDNYRMAKYNFWSACGDTGDYEFYKYCRRRLKECKGKSK